MRLAVKPLLSLFPSFLYTSLAELEENGIGQIWPCFPIEINCFATWFFSGQSTHQAFELKL